MMAGGQPTTATDPQETTVYHQRGYRLKVRRAYCKGCDLCIPACRPGILRLAADDRIEVTDIRACLFCGACAGRCPDFVFVLEREVG